MHRSCHVPTAVQINACKGDNLGVQDIGFGEEHYEFADRDVPLFGRGPGVLCKGFAA